MHLKICETSFGSFMNSQEQDWWGKAYYFFSSYKLSWGSFIHIKPWMLASVFNLEMKKSNKIMNRNYNIFAFFFFLEDTNDIQERSIARIIRDQILKKYPYSTGLVSVATLMSTTNTTYSKSCFSSERCFPYTDWGTKQLHALKTRLPLSSHSRKQLMTSQKMRCLQPRQLLTWSF